MSICKHLSHALRKLVEEESSNLNHLLPNEVEGLLNNLNDVGDDVVVCPPQNHDYNFNSLALDDIDLPDNSTCTGFRGREFWSNLRVISKIKREICLSWVKISSQQIRWNLRWRNYWMGKKWYKCSEKTTTICLWS